MDGANCCCNIIWFIFGGLEACIFWCIFGAIFCCTIIGIPVGLQCFKIGGFTLCPFGKETREKVGGTNTCECILNIFWFCTFGLILAILESFFGVIYCITICGIPFGIQHFKLAKLCLLPFGQEVFEIGTAPPGPIVVVQPIAAQTNVYYPPTTPFAGY